MKLVGRVGADDKEGRFNVEADLTGTKIENLLPGWNKAPGRQARLAFTLVKQKSGGLRFVGSPPPLSSFSFDSHAPDTSLGLPL